MEVPGVDERRRHHEGAKDTKSHEEYIWATGDACIVERIAAQPREGWEKLVEAQGFYFHTTEDGPYWDESAYYRFGSAEIDAIEKATYELNDLCLAAVESVVKKGRWDDFNIAPPYRDWIAQSWEEDELTIVGRFDLAYNGSGPPKLLEYNADTPTSLLEAAVIQWQWMQDCHKDMDQFNSIHEKLIEAWKRAASDGWVTGPVFFSAVAGHVEDYMTVNYLRDTAIQAGLDTEYVDVEKVGWNTPRRAFVDMNERPILNAFKLYPWEWMLAESFGQYLPLRTTRWLEAPWKVLLSNKAILAVLWEMFPDSPYLLPASLQEMTGDFVKKPRQGREGGNVTIMRAGQVIGETGGTYGGPWVWQKLAERRDFDGQYPILGSWMVNGYACGMGIREDRGLITGNMSRFVPHVFG